MATAGGEGDAGAPALAGLANVWVRFARHPAATDASWAIADRVRGIMAEDGSMQDRRMEVNQEDGTAVVTEADIVAGLRRLGLAAGDVVLVHRGQSSVRTFRRYDCSDRGVRRYLGKMEPIFRREGVVRETAIGTCRAMLIGARDNVRLTSDLLRETPEYILTP